MTTELVSQVNIEQVQEITRLHNEIVNHLKMTLDKAIRVGELLIEQKASMEHGQFTSWIESNLPFTDRTARNYMRLFRQRDELKTETVSDLGVTGGYRMLTAPLADLKISKWESKREEERKRIEWAKTHPEEVPVGEETYGKAGAGWDCRFTIVDQLVGLPMTYCECIDPEYWRLKEGEAPSSLHDKLEQLICSIKGIEEIEREITKCLMKYKDVIDNAYWVDWDRGVCSMSSSLTQALAAVGAELAAVIRGFNKRQAPAIEKLLPSAKASGQPRHGWTTWGLEV